ncbi:hypothetical protein AcW1_007569 [Taiwanofungus camphoratus]|nr:hypothetical protein AcW1_007569 [Antrodia cinnamomea]
MSTILCQAVDTCADEPQYHQEKKCLHKYRPALTAGLPKCTGASRIASIGDPATGPRCNPQSVTPFSLEPSDGVICPRSANHRSAVESASQEEAEGRSLECRAKSSSNVEYAHALLRGAYLPLDLPDLSPVVSRRPTTASAVLHATTDVSTMFGSFSPTASPRHSLQALLVANTLVADSCFPSSRVSHPLSSAGPSDSNSSKDLPQDLSSLPNSPTLPSICRTPSSYTDSEYFPTAPSSAGPATPAREVSPSPKGKQRSLHPALESLEGSSKLSVKMCCATCQVAGTNFPSCPRCGEMWCSRQCRLQGTGGKRHACAKGGHWIGA